MLRLYLIVRTGRCACAVIITILLLVFVSGKTIGQTKPSKTDPRNIICQTIIKSLADKNQDSLNKYVNFPVQGLSSDIPELNGERENFYKSFDFVFNSEVRNALKKVNNNSFYTTKESDGTIIYIVDAIYTESEKRHGHQHKKGVTLEIKRFNKTYKLYKFDLIMCK